MFAAHGRRTVNGQTRTRPKERPLNAIASRSLVGKTLSLAVLSAAALVASTPASAHRDGRWTTPPTAQRALDTSRYLSICKGIGSARPTPSSTINPATWLFRHFECQMTDQWAPTSRMFLGLVCVHTTASGRLLRSRIQQSRCRF
jgi:hypothetical protein